MGTNRLMTVEVEEIESTVSHMTFTAMRTLADGRSCRSPRSRLAPLLLFVLVLVPLLVVHAVSSVWSGGFCCLLLFLDFC